MERWTARRIRGLKGRERIPVVTCYDYSMARLCEVAQLPLLLVGDSLGNVVLGYETTVRVTLREMVHHAKAVMRARPKALVVVDMPFLSFQVSAERALESAGRIVRETGADAVKLEGAGRTCEAVRRIVEAGVPVMGHLGLTPQSVLELGGYPVQGRGEAGETLLRDARALEAAGCFSLVLEKIPAALAARVTAAVGIPTIGIGAGAGCDGQVLVLYDLLGLNPEFRPRFVKRYAELGTTMVGALARYADEVRGGMFPGPEHEYADDSGTAPEDAGTPYPAPGNPGDPARQDAGPYSPKGPPS
jgi:3-methyl-2-oxobutanoate hydroxymethyltransferase